MLVQRLATLLPTGITLPKPSSTPSPSSAQSSLPPISQHTHDVALIIVLLLVGVAVGVVLAFIAQGWSTKRRPLLAIPYMTWFILHIVIASLGILAVIALGLSGVLDGTGVSGLLGSLFGYVLGAAKSQGSSTSATSPSPSVTGLWPDTGAHDQTTSVGIAGTNLPTTGAVPTVSFGGTAATDVRLVGPGMIYALAPTHAAEKVDVVVTLATGDALGHTLSFTYT